ncbi:MAG: PAS domain-containing sensor histidine kinase [Planctomycetota bacterium]|nr:MAG: PAS domain-containing sensor histidine kinase [Planctomycetota bacterium]
MERMDSLKLKNCITKSSPYIFSFFIFLLDLKIPLGVAMGMLYVIPILFALLLRSQKHAFFLSVLGSLLTLIGLFLSHPLGVYWEVCFNRSLSIFILWVTYFLVVNQIHSPYLKALEEKQAFLDSIVDTAHDGIITIDQEGRILTFNKGAESLFGYHRHEVLGKNISILMPGEEYTKDHNRFLQRYLASGQKRIIGIGREVVGQKKDGTTFPMYLSVGEFRVGEKHFFTGIVHDLSSIKKVEQEIRHLNEALEIKVKKRTAELEAAIKELEAFCYSVSHDLRAPLRSLDGFSQILLEDYHHLLDEEGQDYLQRIRQASQRMGQLIDDLLDLSKVSRKEMKWHEVNLSQLAREIMENCQQRKPHRKAEIYIQEGMVVNGDAGLLKIALENLLCNAWKFTSKTLHPRISFTMEEREGVHVYHLKDNGAGFEGKFVDKIFLPFQRLHSQEEYPGTGIGLATVQRIIQRHGGRIWAESKVGEGASFFFTISE